MFFDDDFSSSTLQLAVVLLVIVSCLIFVTILFELTKDYAIESASKYSRPILLMLFSEMTVLGFLSLITFIVTCGGSLDELSSEIYGEDGEGYIESTLEAIHYLLFLVMVVTIVQVLMLISIGNTAMGNFESLNHICQSEEDIAPFMDKIDSLPHVTTLSWVQDYFFLGPFAAWRKHEERLKVEEAVVFYSLRREFIECRNSLPPYNLAKHSKRLPNNFDFSKYQSMFLSSYLVKIVHFTPLTWFSLWVFAAAVFGLMMAVDGTSFYMAAIWLLLGYIDVFVITLLKEKCSFILEHLVNPSHFGNDWRSHGECDNATDIGSTVEFDPRMSCSSSSRSAVTETTGLLSGLNSPSQHPDVAHSSLAKRMRAKSSTQLPLWTRAAKQEQSWLSWLSLGKVESNKQERLFWGDKIGRDLNIYILRVHLIVQSVFFAVAGCYYIPFVYEDYGYYWGTAYLLAVVVLIPWQLFDIYPEMIVQMSQIASTGLFKDKKTVKEVIRAQKMARLVRLLVMMNRLKNCTQIAKKHESDAPSYDPNDPLVKAEIQEIGRIFDLYDTDGGGEVDIHELKNMFASFGISLPDDEMAQVFVQLDADGSGSISKQELIDWKMSQAREHKVDDMRHLATEIFNMFDVDGSGEISVDEFKSSLMRFNSGLSEEEIIEIANDLDESGDGNLSLDEFQKAIEQALEY